MGEFKEHSKLYWVSVGGNTCEPARVVFTTDDPKRFWSQKDLVKTIFTIGCPDGTVLTPDCGIILISEISTIPRTPSETKKAIDDWNKRNGIRPHGYRVFT